MKNILFYLNKHKWIIIVLVIVIIFSIILAEKLSNKPKVIERLTCSALNDVKIIIPHNYGLILTNSGDLYELNEKKYSDETNCKKISGKIKINGYSNIYGMSFFNENEVYIYRAPTWDLTKEKYQKPFDIIRGEENYNLKDDGIIYKFEQYDLSQGTFSGEKEFLKFDGEKILDFGVANGKINYVKTDKAYYTSKLINEKECTNYADVECKYELYKDNYLTKNYDKIAGLISKKVIFKNGNIVSYDKDYLHRQDEKTGIDVTYDNKNGIPNSSFNW